MDIQIENMNEFEGRSNTYLSNTFKYLITVLSMIFAFFLSIGEGQAFFCGGGEVDINGVEYTRQKYETQAYRRRRAKRQKYETQEYETQEYRRAKRQKYERQKYETQEYETQEYRRAKRQKYERQKYETQEYETQDNCDASCKSWAVEDAVSNFEARFSSIPHIGISKPKKLSYDAIGRYKRIRAGRYYIEMNYKSILFPQREFKFRISLTTKYYPIESSSNTKKSLIAPYLGTDQEIRVRELVEMLILYAYTNPSEEPGNQLIDAIATLIKPTDQKILEYFTETNGHPGHRYYLYLKSYEGANPEDLAYRPLLQSEIKLFTMIREMGKTKGMSIVDSVIACDSELDTLKVDLQKLIGTITLKEYTKKLNTHGNSKLVAKKSEMKLNLQTAQACQKKLNEYSEYIANTDRNQVAKDSANAAKLESIKATSSKGMAN